MKTDKLIVMIIYTYKIVFICTKHTRSTILKFQELDLFPEKRKS